MTFLVDCGMMDAEQPVPSVLSAKRRFPVPPQVSLGTDPTRVGPYLVEKKLGAGGMGTVYLAHHEGTGKQVAVKVLAPSLAREPGLVARFMREIDALEKLKNPHVVELFDHGVDGDVYYYAMEYVDGETLTMRLRRTRRIPWREVVELSIQICVALKAAHDAGIIHRDLKPSNLLLTPDGQVKLTDFGVAQVFAGSKLTVTGGIIGTAEYMSPEQAQGKRITKRSDLYSLGAVMYVMLTGRPPFSGKTTLDVIHKHKYSQFDRPRLILPELPYWVDEVVCQLMEKDPEKRFADAYVVNRKLQEILRKVEISTNELTMGEEGTRPDSSTVDVGAESRKGISGPGPGTLMRDLFRADIEAQKTQTDLRRVFENTWVLVGLLVALVLGVAYWTFAGKMTPEERFEKGVALLDEDEDANWRTARDQYFQPLVELKSSEWDEKLEPYLRRIHLDELKAGLSGKTGKRGLMKKLKSSTEIERLLALARHQEDNADYAGAERTLSALVAILEGNSQYDAERKLADELLQELRDRRSDQHPDRTFLDDALARADALAAAGKSEEATKIWNGVVDLYHNDPQAAEEVARARRKLTEPKAQTSAAKVPQ